LRGSPYVRESRSLDNARVAAGLERDASRHPPIAEPLDLDPAGSAHRP